MDGAEPGLPRRHRDRVRGVPHRPTGPARCGRAHPGETLSVWLKIARQVVAVEMESAGIYKATHGRNVPFLAIRGISDVVGFKRDPDWTAYACETAAAFAQAFLLSEPIAVPAATLRW
jgi:hypothetical protein